MIASRTALLFLSLVASFLIYQFSNAAENDPKNLCRGEENLVCLQDNFDKLYQENTTLFWMILHNAASKAQKCDSAKDAATFLRLANLKKNNAEFNEFFSQTIEQLCVKKSNCFFDVLLIVDDSTRVLLINKLRTPLFTDNSKIDEVFLGAKANNKYKRIVDIYLLKKNSGRSGN